MKIILLPILLLSVGNLGSQSLATQAVNTTGGSFTHSGGSLEFSLGEVAIQGYHPECPVLTEGLLQPDDFICGTNAAQVLSASDVVLYPNPANSFIHFETEMPGIRIFQLYSDDGRLVFSTIWQSKCPLPRLASGMYYVVLLDKRRHLLWQSKLNITQP